MAISASKFKINEKIETFPTTLTQTHVFKIPLLEKKYYLNWA